MRKARHLRAVIAGLDPAIQSGTLDARIKSGHDSAGGTETHS